MEPIFATFATMAILLILSVPIGPSIGLGVICGIVLGDLPMALFIQKFYNSFDSFPLMAVPFFLLAGDIMARGTLSEILLDFCHACVGHKRGGLAQISVISCLFYGALCGSAAATTAAIGTIMIPAMQRDGYPKEFSAGLNAAAGCLGVMIPPSIPLILFGAFGGVSVSDLFIAGIVPGCLIAAMLLFTAYLLIVRKGYGTLHPKLSSRERIRAFKKAAPALGVPVLILGGIYGGFMTPTEAGCVAVFYAFVIEIFVYKGMTSALFFHILKSSMFSLGMLFMILIPGGALGTLLLYYNVHESLSTLILSMTSSKYVFLLICLVIYIIIGTFLDAGISIIILTPILVPIAIKFGIDPIHFGILTLVTLCVGFLTPPVGQNLFVACSIAKLDILTLARSVMPFMATMLVGVLLITFVPFFSLCLL
ncbi:TRAP transporter large permease [uncultured Mailhella sp.]|uniref:TRAP transporter large permease n=1 Tax=uncultured Mailhella sp. TaxID=1981031 RepID=UPI00260ABBF0|nr:TRAP transporter large permease [uncultured Mailhella sp.]